MKLIGLFLLLISFAGLVNMPEGDQQKSKTRVEQPREGAAPAPTATPETKQRPGTMDTEIKQLAVGGHCAVFESFVFVARDAETYQALENLNINLPTQDPDFFKTHAVIAAFLGQRRTGGFSVDVSKSADGAIHVVEQKPRGMVIQVLTTPFKIVSVPANTDAPLALALDATWTERWRNYRVTSGELSITGGFAGIHEQLTLSGKLQIMRAVAAQPLPSGELSARKQQSLVTILFELHSNGKRPKDLRDVVSGTVTESAQVNLAYLDSHSLSGAIQSPFRAAGQFTPDEQELTLNLDTVDSPHISDNFIARASLKAIAVSPRPPNRAITHRVRRLRADS